MHKYNRTWHVWGAEAVWASPSKHPLPYSTAVQLQILNNFPLFLCSHSFWWASRTPILRIGPQSGLVKTLKLWGKRDFLAKNGGWLLSLLWSFIKTKMFVHLFLPIKLHVCKFEPFRSCSFCATNHITTLLTTYVLIEMVFNNLS